MASDGKYYKRLNFNVNPMAEYEVRESYFRTGVADIQIDDLYVQQSGGMGQAGRVQWADYLLVLRLTNNGGGIADHYKLEVRVPAAINKIAMHSPVQPDRHVKEEVVYIFPNTSPLFQAESITVGQVTVTFSAHRKAHLDIPVTVNVYYTGGSTEAAFTLRDRLYYSGNLLKQQM